MLGELTTNMRREKMDLKNLNKDGLIDLLLKLNNDYNISFLYKTPPSTLRLIIEDEFAQGKSISN